MWYSIAGCMYGVFICVKENSNSTHYERENGDTLTVSRLLFSCVFLLFFSSSSLFVLVWCVATQLCHPGGPGCKTNKNFKQPGYDFEKNTQAEIQVTIQVMPRAKARAMPASNGFKPGPAKLKTPDRPPQPTNPIFDPEGCKAYIVYVCKSFSLSRLQSLHV